MAAQRPNRTVKTSETVFDIIETIHALDGATLSEVAAEVDLAKSTLHDHLSTLVAREYLVREGNEYRIGLKFLSHGMHAKRSLMSSGTIEPTLRQVAEETKEIAWFLVEEHGRGVYIAKAEGEHAIQPYGEIGKRVSLHDIAAGKAILAALSDERIDEIVDRHGLPKRTDTTLGDREELFEEIDRIRERGYALNNGETFDGFRGVGSPIVHEGTVYGSIAVSGPANRLRKERFAEELPEIVAGAANAIELTLASE